MSEQPAPRRYPRSANGLVGSLIVTVVVVLAFIGFRSLFSEDLEVGRTPIDYLPVVALAQDGGFEVAYPTRLPAGWIATDARLVEGDPPWWYLDLLTEEGRYLGLRQEDDSVADLLERYVDADPQKADDLTVEGSVATVWEGYADEGGDLAYAAEVGDETVLVFGSADAEHLEALIRLLTLEPVD